MTAARVNNINLRDLIKFLVQLLEVTEEIDVTVEEDGVAGLMIIDPVLSINNRDPNQVELDDEYIDKIS